MKSVAYPNTVTSTYSYDLLNRLTKLTATTPTTSALAEYQYTLGAAGNRTAVSELSGRSVQYSYDDIYRLTSETITCGTAAPGCGGSVGYTYDAVGNRTQITSTLGAIPSSGTLYYDANDRTATDSYDNDGNTISSGGIGNVYDFENHLVQHGAVTVVYDGDGNRVSETAGGTTTNYLVDALNPTGYAQVVDELQSGLVTRSYAYGLQLIDEGQLVAGSWKLSFYGYDGHGSVRYLTDTTGAITDTYDYDAFGNLLVSTGTTQNNYRFAGEQWDPNLGLYYNRARYYGVNASRFLTTDTFEGIEFDPNTLHKYLYVANNPVNDSDPSGLEGDIATTEAVVAGDEAVESGLESIINATDKIARAEQAAYIVGATAVLAGLILAADVIIENKEKGDDGKLRRGRIGIQGNDLLRQSKKFNDVVPGLTQKLNIGTGGSTTSFSRDTLSWGWFRTWPVLKIEGLSALKLMAATLGSNSLKCRQTALQKAETAINTPGGLPQGFSKDYPGENYSFCDGSERVDIHVIQGSAFEK